MRDVALNLFWVNRFAMTMYEKRPTRWRDVPRARDDVFLPVLAPWQDGDARWTRCERASPTLPPAWDARGRGRIFGCCSTCSGTAHHASELPAIQPTVAELLADPTQLTFPLAPTTPTTRSYWLRRHRRLQRGRAELEALHRLGDGAAQPVPVGPRATRLTPVGELQPTTTSWCFHPRNRDVDDSSDRARARRGHRRHPGASPRRRSDQAADPALPAGRRARAVQGAAARSRRWPSSRARRSCTNEDLIRNTAYSWSPMTAEEISEKTGIESRVYTARALEDIALQAAARGPGQAGRAPEEIGAVIFCSCTSTQLDAVGGDLAVRSAGHVPDALLVRHRRRLRRAALRAGRGDPAAAGGGPAGAAGLRREVLRQDRHRPAVADDLRRRRRGARGRRRAAAASSTDIEVLQTYASGPVSEVNSIIWPNPEFDNNITVYGPEVKALAGRYLTQMIDELRCQPDPDGARRPCWTAST